MFATYIMLIVLVSFVIAALFLYLSGKENEDFIKFWAVSWLFYSCALVCLLSAHSDVSFYFMEIKKLFDMCSVLCVLFGIYKFYRVKIPGYWFRFSIYLAVWLFVAVFLDLDSLSVSLPIFLFDILMTVNLCGVIIRYGEETVPEKVLYCLFFLVWGAIKAYLTIYETGNLDNLNVYIGEILYTNLLNVSMFIIYFRKVKRDVDTTKERFKLIIENAMDAIFYFTFKPAPSFLYITPSIENITGYSPQKFYSDPKSFLSMADKDSFEMINDVFFSGPDKTFPTSEVFKVTTKSGDEIWVEMNVSVIKEENQVVAVEGIIRDITQMKETQDALRTSKRSRDLMLSYISHELKTPITSILGYATALKDGDMDSEEKRHAIDIISQKSLVLERMILDLFQLSQLETQQYSFTYMQMSAAEMAADMHDHIVPELRESGMPYKILIEDEYIKDIDVIVDPVRINQVVTNLVINAIKYTRDKNKITIKCTADKKGENLIISVADKGRGIPEKDIEHVFDRFFKSSDVEKTGKQGSGLGLALSKEIVEAHGGEITVKSKYGKGSIFTLSIPTYVEEY